MTAQWSSTVQIIGGALIHFIWEGIAAATALAIVLLFVPRTRAGVRYALGCLTIAAMAAAPLVTMWELSTRLDAANSASTTAVAAFDAAPAGMAPAGRAQTDSELAVPSATAATTTRSLSWVVAAWVIGVLLGAVRLAGGWWHSRRLLREDAFPAEAFWWETVGQLSLRLGIERRLFVLESARVQVPLVMGCIKPVLLLPAAALAGLSPRQLEAVLAHELAHIRRHDYLVNVLQSLVETVLFYHPAVWWVSHTIRVEREHCCDDLAVAACGDAVLYARALTELESHRHEGAGLAMAVSGGSLVSRVRRLVGARPPRQLASSGWIVVATTAVMVAGAGMAGWMQDFSRIVAGAPLPQAVQSAPTSAPTPPAPSAPSTRGVAVPPAPPAPPAGPSVPAPPSPPAPPPAGVLDMTRSRTAWTSRFTNDGLTTTVRGKGQIEFSDDDADVKRLDEGGFFEIEKSRGWFSWGGRTRFEARGGAEGRITRRYVVDGKELSAEEGRRWLATVLPRLIREMGIGADTRVARILKQSGPDGVLREISQLTSWSAQLHLLRLFEQAQLDSATLARALAQATRAIPSDFELANVLKQASARFALDQTSGAAFASAARTVESDFEQRHALAAALNEPGLPVEVAVLLLETAVPDGGAGMDSDYEMAELLAHIPEAIAVGANGPYFDALRTVGSDYERRRVLSAFAARPGLSDVNVISIAASAGEIASDYESAEVLLAIVQHQRLQARGRDAVLAATRRIESDHERGRVLSAMLNNGMLASTAK